MNKRTFKKRSYTSLAALFLAGTIMSSTSNAFAATVDDSTPSSQDKTQYAIEQVKKTGSVTLSGNDEFDLQKFADAVNSDEQLQVTESGDEQPASDTDDELITTPSDESSQTDQAATDEDDSASGDGESSTVDSDTDQTNEDTAQTDPDTNGNGAVEQPADPDSETASTNADDSDQLIATNADQSSDDAQEETTDPNVINKANVTDSPADLLTMADIDNATKEPAQTILGKIVNFLGDKVTDVTTGIAAALGYPLLFSRFGTQALSDFRTLLNPSRYDVSNTWTDLDEQYDPENSQVYYTKAQDWWDNEAVKQDVSVPEYNDANKSIRATYVAHPDSKKTVIIGQGWTERPDWIGVVSKVWYDMGYNVLMPSQRGQFASDGNLLSFGYYDKTDWKSLVAKVNEMNGDDGEIIFYGQSLGANTALEAASEDGLASNVKAVVADAGYSTLPALGASLYNKALNSVNTPLSKLIIPIHFDNIPFLPYEKIMKHMNNINKFLQGFGLDDVSGIVAAAKTTLPAYFITTEDDAFIPDSQSVAMYNANNSAIKKLWVLDGNVGGHASANNAVTAYQDNIQAFIDEVNKANNLKVNVELTNADNSSTTAKTTA